MPDREVTLGITCPRCKTRNVLLVKDFAGEEMILFDCVHCKYQQEFRHPDTEAPGNANSVKPRR